MYLKLKPSFKKISSGIINVKVRSMKEFIRIPKLFVWKWMYDLYHIEIISVYHICNHLTVNKKVEYEIELFVFPRNN